MKITGETRNEKIARLKREVVTAFIQIADYTWRRHCLNPGCPYFEESAISPKQMEDEQKRLEEKDS